MSTLEELKKQLQSKPIVQSRNPVFIHLEKPLKERNKGEGKGEGKDKDKGKGEGKKSSSVKKSSGEEVTPPLELTIQDKRSEGYDPTKFFGRMKANNLTVVSSKENKQEEPVIIESQAPEIIEPIKPPPKIKTRNTVCYNGR